MAGQRPGDDAGFERVAFGRFAWQVRVSPWITVFLSALGVAPLREALPFGALVFAGIAVVAALYGWRTRNFGLYVGRDSLVYIGALSPKPKTWPKNDVTIKAMAAGPFAAGAVLVQSSENRTTIYATTWGTMSPGGRLNDLMTTLKELGYRIDDQHPAGQEN